MTERRMSSMIFSANFQMWLEYGLLCSARVLTDAADIKRVHLSTRLSDIRSTAIDGISTADLRGNFECENTLTCYYYRVDCEWRFDRTGG